MLGIKLDDKKSISLDNNLCEFISPRYVNISLLQGKLIYESNLKENDRVKVGSIIGNCKKYEIPLFSSISGKVISVENNNIKIENDFKNSLDYEIHYNNIETKEDFVNIIKSKGIVGLSGSMYPTYLKYNNERIKTLIINAIECEPYVTSDYCVSSNYADEIIKVLELMIKILKIEECFIAIKGKNKYLRELFNTKLSDNPKIKVVLLPDLYPMGWSRNLVRYIKHTDYDKHTIEKGIIVNNISTIFSIYEAIFLNKPLIDRVVTFTGENFKNPCNVRVKFGTNIKDVIEFLGGYKESKATLISSGPMMGYNLITDDSPVIASLNSFIAIYPKGDCKVTECLRCGKCIQNCPAKIYPVLIKDNINYKNQLKYLGVEKCIGCGICSYICPAKINLREYVEKARSELNGIH